MRFRDRESSLHILHRIHMGGHIFRSYLGAKKEDVARRNLISLMEYVAEKRGLRIRDAFTSLDPVPSNYYMLEYEEYDKKEGDISTIMIEGKLYGCWDVIDQIEDYRKKVEYWMTRKEE